MRIEGPWLNGAVRLRKPHREIVAGRVKGIGLQFVKNPAQALLNAVHRMIEMAPAYLEPAATGLPIGPQNKVIPKHMVVPVVETPAAHQLEIGDIFFFLA
jgi:hypothetical protein